MARKMGTNGAQVFQRVADSIARQTADGTYTIDDVGRACFTHEALTVRCSDTPDAIACVIAKYRRGLPRSGFAPSQASLYRRGFTDTPRR